MHESLILDNSILEDELDIGKHGGLLLGDAGYALWRYLLVPSTAPIKPNEKRYNALHRESIWNFEAKIQSNLHLGMGTLEFRICRIRIRAISDPNPAVLSDF